MAIRQLPPSQINRIAAGEVIERPASVVKELVENAIDAGAGRIDIVVAGGGLELIRVADDGCGMDAADLALCIERHATSKLSADSCLTDIATLGFRGEALPSIGAVARLGIVTRRPAGEGLALAVDGGVAGTLRPVAAAVGTVVEVRDLFYRTPARLKFMRSEAAETVAIAEAVKRIALAREDIALTLTNGTRTGLALVPAADEAARRGRVARLLGAEFGRDAVPLAFARAPITIAGWVSPATLHRPTAATQHVVVNGRPVRDRLLLGAIRAAYGDLLPRGRQPLAALHITLPLADVDVNVHPAKTELRFRDGAAVRAAIIAAIRGALGSLAVGVGRRTVPESFHAAMVPAAAATGGHFASPVMPFEGLPPAAPPVEPLPPESYPLGAARAQLHDTFILAERADALVIVDAHAAHERLVYERLKAAAKASTVPCQALLVPLVVPLDAGHCEGLLGCAEALGRAGLTVEPFGPGAVIVRAVPAALADADIAAVVRDLAAEAADMDAAPDLAAHTDRLLATIACHGSVRAGRRLSGPEMNALLRAMEAEPAAATCNHGRPTYVTLARGDIARLFARR